MRITFSMHIGGPWTRRVGRCRSFSVGLKVWPNSNSGDHPLTVPYECLTYLCGLATARKNGLFMFVVTINHDLKFQQTGPFPGLLDIFMQGAVDTRWTSCADLQQANRGAPGLSSLRLLCPHKGILISLAFLHRSRSTRRAINGSSPSAESISSPHSLGACTQKERVVTGFVATVYQRPSESNRKKVTSQKVSGYRTMKCERDLTNKRKKEGSAPSYAQ